MRRLLAALAVLATCLIGPGAATDPSAPPAPAPPNAPDGFRPGRVTAAPYASGEEWYHSFREAVAGTGAPAREVLDLQARSAARAGAEEQYADAVGSLVVDDLDGDRVSDVVRYLSVYEGAITSAEGFTEITVYSGRTGALRWRRRIDDLALAQVVVAPVGKGGAKGLVLIRGDLLPGESLLDAVTRLDPWAVLNRGEDRRVRAVGLTNRGRVAYDRTLTTLDGKGDIQSGGLFDAYPGDGYELLFGRVARIAPNVLSVQAVTVDGYDGTVRVVADPEPVVAEHVSYHAAGDLDRDRRADFVEVRGLAAGLGSVIARSVTEQRVLWTAGDVPVGYASWLGGTADVTGDGARDVVLNSVVRLSSLRIAGLPPDDLVLFPRNGTHGVLFDGEDGTVAWDRVDGEDGEFAVWDDVNRDGKRDVISVAAIDGERDGLRLIAVTGRNAELYRREITVPRPAGDDALGYVYASAWPAGDLDGDPVTDVAFRAWSASVALSNQTAGLFLAGRNRVRTTEDWSFGATLDGGTDERVTSAYSRTAASYLFSDGWAGRAYWRVRADAETAMPTDSAAWQVAAVPGARGRCADVLLTGRVPGAVWMDVLDGGTGRVRWSRTLFGTRPKTTVRASGTRVACR